MFPFTCHIQGHFLIKISLIFDIYFIYKCFDIKHTYNCSIHHKLILVLKIFTEAHFV